MPANLTYHDGLLNTAIPVSLPIFSAPFAGIIDNFVLTQDWVIAQADYVPLALDTETPDYSEFLLAYESETRDIGGGRQQWTRTSLKLPSFPGDPDPVNYYDEPRGTFIFTFPGFSGIIPNLGFVGIGGPSVGRLPLSETVPLKVRRAFYNTTDPFDDITIEDKFSVYYSDPGVTQAYVGDANGLYIATTPSRTDYDALVSGGTYIVAEDTTWQRWMGNFYISETFYVKAI